MTATAAPRDTKPLGIGLGSSRSRSRGASITSLRAPIANWSAAIESPRRIEVSAPPPATNAVPATTRPSRIEGNGWTSRNSAAARRGERSDVNELVEVLDQIVDQSFSTVLGLGADARNQGVERDRRDHLSTLCVSPDGRDRPIARSEHPFDVLFTQPGSIAE